MVIFVIITVLNSKSYSKSIINHKVKYGETLYSLSRKYHTSVQSIKSLNNIANNKLKKGMILKIQYNRNNSSNNYKTNYNNRLHYSSKKLYWPINGSIIKSFGNKHQLFSSGIQIQGKSRFIRSSSAGKVIFVGYLRGNGLTVIIKHNSNLHTVYSVKNASSLVKEGIIVKSQEKIISSYHSQKVLLYFKVWYNNQFVNPINYLKN